MKKILLVTTSFPSLLKKHNAIGGAAFLLDEAKALVSAGYSVKVLMPAIGGLGLEESIPGIELERIEYPLAHYNPGYNRMPQHGTLSLRQKISQFSMAFAIFNKVRLELKKVNYHLLWSNWLQVGVLCSCANRFKVPHLMSIRGSDVRESKKISVKVMSLFCRDLLNMYEDDEALTRWVSEFGFRNIIVPGVYSEKILVRKKNQRSSIVVLGRLDDEASSLRMKGLGDNLFYALKQLLSANTDFDLVVIGDGKSLNKYKNILADYSERITYTGWIRDFENYLSSASVVIGGGGTNGVVMDNAPYGVPLMISKYLMGTIWVDKVNCLSYDPYDIESLIAAMSYALDNRDELDGFAQQAKQDLERFALPTRKAGEVWRKKIDEFCYSQSTAIK